LEQANAVLQAYLPRFNAQFAVEAAAPGLAYRPLPQTVDLETLCCFKYARTVALDNTVQLGEHRLQLLPDTQRRSYARAHVEVHERLDGSLAVYYAGRCLVCTPAPLEAPVLRARAGRLTAPAQPTLSVAAEPTEAVARCHAAATSDRGRVFSVAEQSGTMYLIAENDKPAYLWCRVSVGRPIQRIKFLSSSPKRPIMREASSFEIKIAPNGVAVLELGLQ